MWRTNPNISGVPSPKTTLILVGINYYPRSTDTVLLNHRGRPQRIKHLRGAVADVDSLESYANGFPNVIVKKLTSSMPLPGNIHPPEPSSMWPTYDKIIETIEEVIDYTGPGDVIHLHFSCHGTRVPTLYPHIKAAHPDEAIVPMDIFTRRKLIRDVDLYVYLRRMSDKHAHVSIVCDCCYSGSVMRGDSDDSDDDSDDDSGNGTHETSRRGIDEVCANNDVLNDIPREDNILDALSRLSPVRINNNNMMRRHTLLEVGTFEMFASCHIDQRADEVRINGVSHGLYTGQLLAILQERRHFTYGQLHQRLSATMRHQTRHRQDPVFSGNRNRFFLDGNFAGDNGTDSTPLSVIEIGNSHDMCVRLSEGSMQGVTCGSTYAIYPWNATSFHDIATRPLVEVNKVSEDSSGAVWMGETPFQDVEIGSQAVLRRYKVPLELPIRPDCNISSVLQDKLLDMQSWAEQTNDGHDVLIRLVTDSREDTPYSVFWDDAYQQYQLCYNNNPVRNFPMVSEPEDFLYNLAHLARHEFLRTLHNLFTNKDSNELFEITITSRNTGEPQYHHIHGYPPSTTPELYPGLYSLNFHNNSDHSLHFTVFAITAEWGVEQILPSPESSETQETCEGHDTCSMDINLEYSSLWPGPDGYTTYLKIFVLKKGNVSFHSTGLLPLIDETDHVYRGDEDEAEDLRTMNYIFEVLEIPGRNWKSGERRERVWWTAMDVSTRVIP